MTFLLILIFLGVLISVHEFGHFIACKISKIGVEEFSIGFGPRLLSFNDKSETRYIIALIPFGGYVKMQGEEKREERKEGDFWLQPFYKKILVVISGPLFNFLLAIVAFLIGYSLIGYETLPIYRVYEVKSPTSPFMPNDSILSIDGKQVKTIEDVYYYFSKAEKHEVEVLRNNDKVILHVAGRNFDSLGVNFYIPPIVNRVEKGSPAYKAGLRKFDRILSFNETEIHSWMELVDSIRANPNRDIALKVLRGTDTLVITLHVAEELGSDGKKFGKIGITPLAIKRRLSLLNAIAVSITRSLEVTWIFIVYIIRLFTGRVPLSNLGGPIMIGKVIYTTTSYGAFQLLYLLGLISINLCIVNLLPIPALDGFHFWVYLLEGVTKKELPTEAKRILQLIGFAILLILMVIIAAFDILRLIR